jgi:tRNA G10  N-methylase Trm11
MTQEFRSRIDELVETKELPIRQDTAFGKYKHLFPVEARSHPAKYNPELAEFLIEKYTQPGDTVLDCMAGTGLMGVVAALHGRNAIQVELEPRYFSWMEKARENVERLNTLEEKGKIINILGDSRRLTELLAEHVGAVITSPPYADSKKGKADVMKMAERWDEKYREYGGTWEGGSTWKTPGRLRGLEALGSGYPESPENIGNLPLGDTDKLEKQDGLHQLYKKLLTKKGKPTYLSEMLLVYKNMFDVLRPGGVACVVVKPFIKGRRVVDLPYITWCLLRAVGFALEKAYKWRIERPSFWRILLYKKNPEFPRLNHEYVVVVRKPEVVAYEH